MSNMSNFFQFDNNMAIILAETCQEITEYMQSKKKRKQKWCGKLHALLSKVYETFMETMQSFNILLKKKTLKGKDC